jgi:hypothetical protein
MTHEPAARCTVTVSGDDSDASCECEVISTIWSDDAEETGVMTSGSARWTADSVLTADRWDPCDANHRSVYHLARMSLDKVIMLRGV